MKRAITKDYADEDRLTRAEAAKVLGVTERRLDQLRIDDGFGGQLRTERSIATRKVRFRFKDVAELRDRRAAMEEQR